MKQFDWNDEKNKHLQIERDISFEEIIYHIQNGDLLDDLSHPNQKKYPKQRMYIVKVGSYAYLVPYLKEERKYFLKTIIPSRKATQEYLNKEKNDG